jgi:hypothetical protein
MNLNTVREIERAIDALSPEQRAGLSHWRDERYSRPIDTQLRADIEAGRFDDRIARAIADDKAGTALALAHMHRTLADFGKTIGRCQSKSARGPTNNLRYCEKTPATLP